MSLAVTPVSAVAKAIGEALTGTSSLPSNGTEERRATFLSVSVRAERDQTFRSVHVHASVDVDRSKRIVGIELRRQSLAEYSSGSFLLCELSLVDASQWVPEAVERASSAQHSAREVVSGGLSFRYVVLTFRGHVVAVEDIVESGR